jgi:hypothetical protein
MDINQKKVGREAPVMKQKSVSEMEKERVGIFPQKGVILAK